MPRKQIYKKKPLWITVLFVLFLLFLLISLFKAAVSGSSFFIDSLFFVVCWVLFFIFYERAGISDWVVPLVAFAFFMSMAGLYDAYNLSLFGIGYDKYLHIITAFVATIALFQFFIRQKSRSVAAALILAFIVMNGFSAIAEVSEFTGSIYGGITKGFLTMQAGEDYYPASDLVRYDTHWDLIFSMFGGLLAAAFCSISHCFGGKKIKRH